MDKTEWYKVREIAYSSLIGSHIDPKKLPKSKEKFIQLEDKKQGNLNQKQLERIIQVTKEYNDKKRLKNG